MEHFPVAVAINFLILVGFLVFKLRKPITHQLIDEHQKLKTEIEEVEILKQKTLNLFEDSEKKLKNLNIEMDEILNTAKAEAEKEKEIILSRAQKTADQILAQVKIRELTEIKKTENNLKSEVLKKSIELSKKDLSAELTQKDQDAFIREFIRQVEAHHVG